MMTPPHHPSLHPLPIHSVRVDAWLTVSGRFSEGPGLTKLYTLGTTLSVCIKKIGGDIIVFLPLEELSGV